MPWSEGVFDSGGPKILKLAQKFLFLFKILCLALVQGGPIATLLLLYIYIYNIYNNGPKGSKRPAQGMFLGWAKTVTENWPFSKVGITPGQDPLSKTVFLGLSKIKWSSPKYFKRADKNPHSLKFFFSFKVAQIALSIEELLQRI